MNMDYHSEIGFPDVPYITGTYDVEASGHARRESNKDRYGGFNLPTRINLTEAMYERDPKKATGSAEGETTIPHVFEITVENGRIVKLGARTNYDEKRDLVLILKPREGIVVTAWINVKGDAHHTLNRDKYAKPSSQC